MSAQAPTPQSMSPESTSLKRKDAPSNIESEADTDSPAAKKSKSTPQTTDQDFLERCLKLTPSALSSLSKENLVTHYRALQQSYKALAKEKASVGASSGQAPLSKEDLKNKVDLQVTTIGKGIKKQMKWQPSCKQGKTKWS